MHNAAGEYAEIDYAGRGKNESRGDGRRDRDRLELLLWLPEVHRDDHTKIIVGADNAIDRGDDDKPDDVRIERRLELAEA